MLKVTEIAFSCYAVTDMARARKFYEEVLGLKPTLIIGEPGGMQWTEYEFGQHCLSIGCAPGMFQPSPDGCSVALEVEDFEEAVAQLRKHNVKFRIEPMATPVCQMAMFFDPDGNTIGIHKRKAK